MFNRRNENVAQHVAASVFVGGNVKNLLFVGGSRTHQLMRNLRHTLDLLIGNELQTYRLNLTI